MRLEDFIEKAKDEVVRFSNAENTKTINRQDVFLMSAAAEQGRLIAKFGTRLSDGKIYTFRKTALKKETELTVTHYLDYRINTKWIVALDESRPEGGASYIDYGPIGCGRYDPDSTGNDHWV